MILLDYICRVLPIPTGLGPLIALIVMVILLRRAWVELDVSPESTRWAVVAALFFGVADWVLLEALPLLGLSFGPADPTWLALTLIRWFPLLVLAVFLKRLKNRRSGELPTRSAHIPLLALWVLNLCALPIMINSMYFEPFNVILSQVQVKSPLFLADRPLRIVHLSDLHVEGTTRRERQLVKIVSELDPDLILLTGDYVHIDLRTDPVTLEHTRQLLAQFQAPYGVYAVIGSSGVDIHEAISAIFDGLDIRLLRDEVQRLGFENQDLYLVGVSNLGTQRDTAVLRQLMEQIPDEAYTLLLYHTPELAESAAEAGIDLHLAGHTHGGQIGLSVMAMILKYGYGFEYIEGLYPVGPMTLYITRGVGMEGIGYPRIRFNSPPEVVLIELGP